MLEIEDLRVRRQGFELGPLSLTLARGDYFVLLGPSGSGKTTLLEWIAGFVKGQSGRLRIGAQDATALAPQRRDLGVVYQDSALFPHMSVRENLAFSLKMGKWPPERIVHRVGELAHRLHIEHRLDASVAEISGGEQRRVALGRALARGQKVLLLDEPLSGLDPALRRELRRELRMLQRELELSVLHITHLVEEARALGDRVGVLLDGRLIQSGSFDELTREPASAAVARALLVANFIEGEADPSAGGIRVEGGTLIPAPVGEARPVRARVRGLFLARERPGGAALRASYLGEDMGENGEIEALVCLGEEAHRDSMRLNARFTSEVPREALRSGEKLWLDLSRADWYIY